MSKPKSKPETAPQEKAGGDCPRTPCSPFVVAPHTLQFRCETAVYRGDSGTSVCYVTCDEAGRFVAAALNHFADSGEMAKYLSENVRPLAPADNQTPTTQENV